MLQVIETLGCAGMSKNESLPPWATGPAEILRHGHDLLREDADSNRRLAMIAIDNSVELTIKTYLGLPKRITGLKISRKEFNEISESFPALLDALEVHAKDKIAGIDLGEIEWYHRLRNELYHQGNGLTVERDKVEVYGQLANSLFKNFFEVDLVHPTDAKERRLGEFLDHWIQLERGVMSMAHDHSLTGSDGMNFYQAVKLLRGANLVDKADETEFKMLRKIRNDVVHGSVEHGDALTSEIISRIKQLAEEFKEE